MSPACPVDTQSYWTVVSLSVMIPTTFALGIIFGLWMARR